MNTASKEYVFRKYEELKTALRWDTFNLPRESQALLENKLQEFFNMLNQEYQKVEKPTQAQ
jgi:hypothetical protein